MARTKPRSSGTTERSSSMPWRNVLVFGGMGELAMDEFADRLPGLTTEQQATALNRKVGWFLRYHHAIPDGWVVGDQMLRRRLSTALWSIADDPSDPGPHEEQARDREAGRARGVEGGTRSRGRALRRERSDGSSVADERPALLGARGRGAPAFPSPSVRRDHFSGDISSRSSRPRRSLPARPSSAPRFSTTGLESTALKASETGTSCGCTPS